MLPIRQAIFLIAGIVAVFAMQFVKPKFFSWLIPLLPLIWVCMLRFNWYYNGEFMPGHFVELAKICLIIAIAFFLSDDSDSKLNRYYKLAICLSVTITCGLMAITNLSMAIILFTVIVTMLFFSIISVNKIMVSFGIVVFAIGLFTAPLFLASERSLDKLGLHRAVVWKHRLIDCFEIINNNAYFDNHISATVENAMANGGIAGVFPGNGHLPDNIKSLAYCNFIYGNIVEEMGILGGIAVCALYILLLWRAIIIARRCKQLYHKLLVAGSALIITIPALINMGQTIMSISITAMYLPLISFGGSSVISACIFVGIILCADRFENIEV
jgi:cell division protein FtsW